jgi:hypothetical protein
VKELKGETENMDSNDLMKVDQFILDSEFPPENLVTDEEIEDESEERDSNSSDEAQDLQFQQQRKSTLLTQINSRSGSIKPTIDSTPPAMVTSMTLSENNEVLGQSEAEEKNLEQLINLHRHHLRLCTELSKTESKLIVTHSMKSKGASDRVSSSLYVQELSDIINKKLQSILELQMEIEKNK